VTVSSATNVFINSGLMIVAACGAPKPDSAPQDFIKMFSPHVMIGETVSIRASDAAIFTPKLWIHDDVT
jgi:hypothetical protein